MMKRRREPALCSRCTQRTACISCCDTRYCLRHFHTSGHSAEHPRRAAVTNPEALAEQRPAFEEMWDEAFQAVASDIAHFSATVTARLERDPLGTIGMSAAPLSAPPCRAPPDGGGAPPLARRRGRGDPDASRPPRRSQRPSATGTEEEEDLSARRRPKRMSYWSIGGDKAGGGGGGGGGGAASSMASAVAAPAPAVARRGEHKCEHCGEFNTSFDIIGGAGRDARKNETWGNKDAPEMIIRVSCSDCGYSWVEES